jgi:hypothetical protein
VLVEENGKSCEVIPEILILVAGLHARVVDGLSI